MCPRSGILIRLSDCPPRRRSLATRHPCKVNSQSWLAKYSSTVSLALALLNDLYASALDAGDSREVVSVAHPQIVAPFDRTRGEREGIARGRTY